MSKRLKPADVLRIARTFGDPWEGTAEGKKSPMSPAIQKLKEARDKVMNQMGK